MQRLQAVFRQGCGIVRVMPPECHFNPVIARQPVLGGDPDIACMVLFQAYDIA